MSEWKHAAPIICRDEETAVISQVLIPTDGSECATDELGRVKAEFLQYENDRTHRVLVHAKDVAEAESVACSLDALRYRRPCLSLKRR